VQDRFVIFCSRIWSFRVGLINGDIDIHSGIPVAMATKFGTKLAITLLA